MYYGTIKGIDLYVLPGDLPKEMIWGIEEKVTSLINQKKSEKGKLPFKAIIGISDEKNIDLHFIRAKKEAGSAVLNNLNLENLRAICKGSNVGITSINLEGVFDEYYGLEQDR